MEIKVILRGSLYRYMDGNKTSILELPELATTQEMLKTLGIPPQHCSFMMVNGVKVSREYELNNGDEIVVFPLVSGG